MQQILSDERRYSRSKPKQERRANRTEDQLPRHEGIKRLHDVGGKHLVGRLGPLKRWLRARSGNHWNDVFSEAAQVFRQNDFVGKHLRSKLLEMVERNTFMRDREVWCLSRAKWDEVKELPVHKLPKGGRLFYVHPETGILCKIPDRPRPPLQLQQAELKFGGVRRWLPKDCLLLKLEGYWFECWMRRYPERWQEAPHDVVFKTLLIESHAREAYGEPVYCVRKRQLSRKELRKRGLSDSRTAADSFLTVLGDRLLGRIQRANGNPVRCWLQCRIYLWTEASSEQAVAPVFINQWSSTYSIHMRPDMHKVLCEEPRGGQYWARRFPRPQIDHEDAPKQEGIKRPHTRRKWFGEHLGPLKRWLRSNVGRPWNDVYSEGSPIFKPDSIVRAHIRFHLLQMVKRETFMRDGEVWHRDYGTEHKVRGGITCWPVFYVHPESGLLFESHSTWRKERAAKREEEQRLCEERWLNDNTLLKRIGGIWYEFKYRKPRDGAGVFDLLERRVVFSHNVGPNGACASKRQLAQRELKRYGLVNRPMTKARSSGHFSALKTAFFAVSYQSTTIPGGCMAKHMTDGEQPNFEITSKRRKGFPSETQVGRGDRIVHGNKELFEKLGRNDLCPCGSGQKFPELLPALRQI